MAGVPTCGCPGRALPTSTTPQRLPFYPRSPRFRLRISKVSQQRAVASHTQSQGITKISHTWKPRVLRQGCPFSNSRQDALRTSSSPEDGRYHSDGPSHSAGLRDASSQHRESAALRGPWHWGTAGTPRSETAWQLNLQIPTTQQFHELYTRPRARDVHPGAGSRHPQAHRRWQPTPNSS